MRMQIWKSLNNLLREQLKNRLWLLLPAFLLILETSCTTMDQETFQMAFNSAYAPDKNIKGPQKGKALIYGNVFGITPKGRLNLIFRDQKTKNQIHLDVENLFDNSTGKYFLFEIPEGTYELLGFEYLYTNIAMNFLDKYYWFSDEGLKSIRKLGRKPSKSEYESADHDKITLVADKIYYVGDWMLNSYFPILFQNIDRAQDEIKKEYPKLDLGQSETLIPEITIPKEKQNESSEDKSGV